MNNKERKQLGIVKEELDRAIQQGDKVAVYRAAVIVGDLLGEERRGQ